MRGLLMETLALPSFFYCLIAFSSTLLQFCIAADTISPGQSISGIQTLVSSDKVFELGFFSSGNNKSWYLGIWYKKTPGVLVWIANQNSPVTDPSAIFTISDSGTLVLLNQSNHTIWYSNPSRPAQIPVAQLLSSGNLVLIDKVTSTSESYLWKSYDYPINTWLPGMIIGKDMSNGLNRFLTSCKDSDIASPGDSTYKFDYKGLPQIFIKRGTMKKFRTGPWNGVRFSGLPMPINQFFFPILASQNDMVGYMYEPKNKLVSTRITLSESGILQRFVLMEGSTEWTTMDAVPNDMCDNYGQCGPNSVCRSYKESTCECLEGFIPKSPEEWKLLNSSSGCVRRTPLECLRKDSFMKLEWVKLPDLLEFWLNKTMSTKECEAECLKNCSCTAYANSDINGGGNGCLIWFGNLIDIRGYNQENPGQDLYIRLATSELRSIRESNVKEGPVVVLMVSVICGMLTLGFIYWCITWKITSRRLGLLRKKEDIEVPLFDFTTVATATNKFSQENVIGAGGFGPVYKGHLSNGQNIAVKRLSKDSRQGLKEFKNEVVLIAKLQHRNLVRLLGYCIQGDEKMLIYEYMPNKSLNYFIFEQNGSALLTWPKRLDIVLGIVRGLLYLHQDSRLQVIHRDLKASNILLDINLNPKISDFGLARTFGGDESEMKTERVVGTHFM
ncbi:G-type lectin S-receptor-like serine/threonine-protein kinase At4g27290 isoform X2 [Quercus robur]|uniref:G-type lectin S-receptor-like serine/threonine-protein kinase At4g27290 isoform X2 n=1 Tax=Quercus robur TaxID=38942 RepID=UPI002162976B|nr:G-type lectin S-receptor-like serine/threonine-protein kinase At4g27290 isoform X2 [Quercus robur]